MEKKACFIGHRNVPDTDTNREKIRKTVEKLICEENVTSFLFGSRGTFSTMCYTVVSELQEKYPHIQRIAYTCRHEYAVLKEENSQQKRIWRTKEYEGEYEYPAQYFSGKADYVERNQAMIRDSDFCVFYFDKDYLPPRRKYGKHDLTDYQPNSGTAVAYRYAVQKKKKIVNLFEQ